MVKMDSAGVSAVAGVPLLPDVDDLLALASSHASAYAAADPYPHAVIDGLFDVGHLRAVVDELPSRDTPGWVTWDTRNEWKHVFDKPEHFGPAARQLADTLNSSEFVRFVERLTSTGPLIPDPHLTAAGYFDVTQGGFLDVHIDFARNPKLALVRRVNVLVYLNDDWQEDWGGSLELWRTLSDGPVQSIVPVMNRMVVFSTPGAPHGHPKPIAAPAGRSRLCFSAYYFSSPDAEEAPPESHGVLFSATGEGNKLVANAKMLVPPLAIDGAKAVRRALRRRRAR